MSRAPVAGGIFFVCALVLVFGAFSVGRKVNVDENVFVASAALVSCQGLTLYRDFHYNHMPTLVLIYAWLFGRTGYFLLAARSFSAFWAAGTAAIVFSFAYCVFESLGRRRRAWLAIGVGVFFLCNPLFTRTAGRAWNHDFPVFCSVLGFLVVSSGLKGQSKGDRQDAKIALILLGGFLVGMAVTTRLTFATELLPFGLLVLIYPNLKLSGRVAILVLFAAGILIAAAPSIWVWTQSPANAYFGNFQYPAFNTQWHSLNDNSEHHRYTLLSKIWFYLYNTCLQLPGDGIVLAGFVILVKSKLNFRAVMRDPWHCQLFILAILAASQIGAGLVPSPPFFPYFYAATPFMMLAIVMCLGKVPDLGADRGLNWIFAGCLALTLGFAIPEYRGIPRLFSVGSWWPVKVHEIGIEVARLAGKGPVLTLDPIYALEGGAAIYPGVSTGPFGMRVGDYLSEKQRERFHMWGTNDIERLFSEHPPPAVLISPGSDADIEKLFTDEARDCGYQVIQVNAKNPAIQLWLPGRSH